MSLIGCGPWSIPAIPKDVEQVHALQDAIKVSQTGSRQVRGAELGSGEPEEGARRAAGAWLDHRRLQERLRREGQVDPVRHLIGTAAGWGGNPDKDATYLSVTPEKNDGNTVYKLTVPATCRSTASGRSASTTPRAISRRTRTTPTRSTTSPRRNPPTARSPIQFGGCDGKIPNCLPIMKGWNYTVRLYRPRPEILDGKWKFPEPKPVS